MHNSANGVTAIQKELTAYADRGVFRAYHDKRISRSQHEFRFVWLKEQPFRLVYKASNNRLIIKALFSSIDRQSIMDKRLRQFLQSRHAKTLPQHRRIDKQTMHLSCINENGFISIALKISAEADYRYVVNKTINLISDVFHQFLHQPECTDYVRENFGIAGE